MIVTLLPAVAVVAAVATPPPPMPLPAEQQAAARRLIAANPPSADERDQAVRAVVSGAADRALDHAGITPRTLDRWSRLRNRLEAFYAAHLKPYRAEVDAAVDQCLVDRYAGAEATDIDAATAFFSTAAGHDVWPVIADRSLVIGCTSTAVRDDRLGYREGMEAVGLKPPPAARPILF